ncbi:MAG: phosphoglycerate kinase, partial [Patescibacteria group bacterium]
ELAKSFKPKKPFLFVLGGKKFATKEPLINKFLKNTNYIFLCGALANTFLRERGYNIGKSIADDTKIPKKILWNKKIILPSDAVIARAGKKINISIDQLCVGDAIYDIGRDTSKQLAKLAQTSKFILWNGTLGICEIGFYEGTKQFAKAIGKSKAYSIVGGGDTISAIRQLKLEKNFDFISTGGGAMLEFLAKGTLPGITALEK